MKKVSIVIVLILAFVLVAVTSCSALTLCSHCGTYVSQADRSLSIEIFSDGTAYFRGGGTQTSGIYFYDQSNIRISWNGYPFETRAVIRGAVMTGDGGMVWVKQ